MFLRGLLYRKKQLEVGQCFCEAMQEATARSRSVFLRGLLYRKKQLEVGRRFCEAMQEATAQSRSMFLRELLYRKKQLEVGQCFCEDYYTGRNSLKSVSVSAGLYRKKQLIRSRSVFLRGYTLTQTPSTGLHPFSNRCRNWLRHMSRKELNVEMEVGL